MKYGTILAALVTVGSVRDCGSVKEVVVNSELVTFLSQGPDGGCRIYLGRYYQHTDEPCGYVRSKIEGKTP